MVTMAVSVQAVDCGVNPTYDAVILKDLSDMQVVRYPLIPPGYLPEGWEYLSTSRIGDIWYQGIRAYGSNLTLTVRNTGDQGDSPAAFQLSVAAAIAQMEAENTRDLDGPWDHGKIIIGEYQQRVILFSDGLLYDLETDNGLDIMLAVDALSTSWNSIELVTNRSVSKLVCVSAPGACSLDVPYYPAYDALSPIDCMIQDKEGKTECDGIWTRPSPSSMSFISPQCDVGQVITFSYVKTSLFPIPGHFWSRHGMRLEAEYPMEHMLNSLKAPADVVFWGSKNPMIRQAQDGGTHSVWEVKNAPAYGMEMMMPPIEQSLPVAWFSSIDGWDVISSKILMSFERAIQRDMAYVVALDAADPSMDDKQVIHSMLSWVRNNIKKVPSSNTTLERMPKAAGDTMNSGLGDDQDIAALLISMLRSFGIESYPAFIIEGNPDPPHPGRISHAIVWVNCSGEILWLDPSCIGCGDELVADSDRGKLALIARPDGRSLESLPQLIKPAKETFLEYLINIGDSVSRIHMKRERNIMVEDIPSDENATRDASLQLLKIVCDDPVDMDFIITILNRTETLIAEANCDAISWLTKNTLSVPSMIDSQMGGVISASERRYPLMISSPQTKRVRTVLTFSDNSQKISDVKMVQRSHDLASYSFYCTVATPLVLCEQHLQEREGNIPPLNFPRFKEFYEQMALDHAVMTIEHVEKDSVNKMQKKYAGNIDTVIDDPKENNGILFFGMMSVIILLIVGYSFGRR